MLRMYAAFVFDFTKVMKRILIGFNVLVVDGCAKITLMQRTLYILFMVENCSALTVLCKLTLLIFIDFVGSLNCAVAIN